MKDATIQTPSDAASMTQGSFLKKCATFVGPLATNAILWHVLFVLRVFIHIVCNSHPMKYRKCSNPTGNAWTANLAKSVVRLQMRICSCSVGHVIDLTIRSAWRLRSNIFQSNGNANIASNADPVGHIRFIMKETSSMESIFKIATIRSPRISAFVMNVVKMNSRNFLAIFAMKKQHLSYIGDMRL